MTIFGSHIPTTGEIIDWAGNRFVQIVTGVVAFIRYMNACDRKWRTRQQLLELDERQLRDIGITRDEAMREAGKPFLDDELKRQNFYHLR